MKLVIGIIYGSNIAYNLIFKISHQIKVRKLMKEEENRNIPMTQIYLPQNYLKTLQVPAMSSLQHNGKKNTGKTIF